MDSIVSNIVPTLDGSSESTATLGSLEEGDAASKHADVLGLETAVAFVVAVLGCVDQSRVEFLCRGFPYVSEGFQWRVCLVGRFGLLRVVLVELQRAFRLGFLRVVPVEFPLGFRFVFRFFCVVSVELQRAFRFGFLHVASVELQQVFRFGFHFLCVGRVEFR